MPQSKESLSSKVYNYSQSTIFLLIWEHLNTWFLFPFKRLAIDNIHRNRGERPNDSLNGDLRIPLIDFSSTLKIRRQITIREMKVGGAI